MEWNEEQLRKAGRAGTQWNCPQIPSSCHGNRSPSNLLYPSSKRALRPQSESVLLTISDQIIQ